MAFGTSSLLGLIGVPCFEDSGVEEASVPDGDLITTKSNKCPCESQLSFHEHTPG